MKFSQCLCLVLNICILPGCGGGSGDTAGFNLTESDLLLQERLDAVPDGGTLMVEDSIYYGHFSVRDKVVHLQGQGQGTVIDGRGSTCLSINNASGSTISGFIFVNCDDGVSTDSDIVLRDNSFFDNVDGVDYEGGGGLLENNRFYGNKDDAVDLDGAVSVVINDNLISDSGDDGIEVRMHPYEGETLTIVITDNVIKSNRGNGIQVIDYEVHTDRSFEIVGNTFIENRYNGIAYADDQDTSPSFEIGHIAIPIEIVGNSFYEGRYAFTGSGEGTVFKDNSIFSTMDNNHLNTTPDLPIDDNRFIPLN